MVSRRYCFARAYSEMGKSCGLALLVHSASRSVASFMEVCAIVIVDEARGRIVLANTGQRSPALLDHIQVSTVQRSAQARGLRTGRPSISQATVQICPFCMLPSIAFRALRIANTGSPEEFFCLHHLMRATHESPNSPACAWPEAALPRWGHASPALFMQREHQRMQTMELSSAGVFATLAI